MFGARLALPQISQEELFKRDRQLMENEANTKVEAKQPKQRGSLALVTLNEDERQRMDMTIDTDAFNTKPGEVISCDDVDDEVLKANFYLPKEK